MKGYLGDGVYGRMLPAGQGIVLTTENGIRATNTIYLEPAVLEALLEWIRAQATLDAAAQAAPEEQA